MKIEKQPAPPAPPVFEPYQIVIRVEDRQDELDLKILTNHLARLDVYGCHFMSLASGFRKLFPK